MKLNALPVSLSAPQKRKLMGRGAVTLKPAQFSEDGDVTLMVMPNTIRRVATAMKNGKGVRIMLKSGEKMMDNKTGGNLLDDMKDAFSKVSRIVDKVPEPVKSIAVKVATDLIKKRIGLGAQGKCCAMASKGSMMVGRGRNILDEPVSARQVIKFIKDIPAEIRGTGFKPAGSRDLGSGMMVQLGSPYLATNSPAQKPFIAKSIQLSGRGFMPAGSGFMPAG